MAAEEKAYVLPWPYLKEGRPCVIPQAAIRNALRKLWLWSGQRREAKRVARIAPGLYLCALCQRAHREKEVDIDHIEAVGPTPGSKMGKERSWDDFMRRLFCPAEGLRCICRPCHRGKTNGKTRSA